MKDLNLPSFPSNPNLNSAKQSSFSVQLRGEVESLMLLDQTLQELPKIKNKFPFLNNDSNPHIQFSSQSQWGKLKIWLH
jgi:hypothetical protein